MNRYYFHTVGFIFALMTLILHAAFWPTLEKYASDCVLIVKARQIGDFTATEGHMLTFEVIETWKGRFDPREFVTTTPQGYIRAGQGEHGVRVTAGQEIVFFYTHDNQPKGKLARHSTSFPITSGKIVYGLMSDDERVFTTAKFKDAIIASSVSSPPPTQPKEVR